MAGYSLDNLMQFSSCLDEIRQKSENRTRQNQGWLSKVNQTRGFKRVVNATRYSWQGIRAAWRGEAAFRQELVLFVLLLPVAWWLGQSLFHTSILIGCGLLVLMVELLNSAIEAITDRVSTEHHALSGRAKDMGSAAVLLSLLNMGLVWGSALVEKLQM